MKFDEFEKAYGDVGEWLIDLEQEVLLAENKEKLENFEEVMSFYFV